MMGLKICLGIFFVLFLFLLIPIRYRFILEIKHFAVTVEFIFGLYKKTIELSGKKRERIADTDEKIEELLFADEGRPAAAQRAKMILADKAEPEKAPEEKTKENKEEKHKESADEGKGEKKKHPPLWKQLRFAIHNGLAENIFKALAVILVHSMPRKWNFCGEFGTGDPMQTGLLAGMAKAFLPEATKNIVWKYIEPSYKLKGKGQGRIIPFYVV
ncbi:MAG: hypothetical protein HXL70_04860, partial [Dialister invisus]|nr:hypothetical protein [Dialister invisus]